MGAPPPPPDRMPCGGTGMVKQVSPPSLLGPGPHGKLGLLQTSRGLLGAGAPADIQGLLGAGTGGAMAGEQASRGLGPTAHQHLMDTGPPSTEPPVIRLFQYPLSARDLWSARKQIYGDGGPGVPRAGGLSQRQEVSPEGCVPQAPH